MDRKEFSEVISRIENGVSLTQVVAMVMAFGLAFAAWLIFGMD